MEGHDVHRPMTNAKAEIGASEAPAPVREAREPHEPREPREPREFRDESLGRAAEPIVRGYLQRSVETLKQHTERLRGPRSAARQAPKSTTKSATKIVKPAAKSSTKPATKAAVPPRSKARNT